MKNSLIRSTALKSALAIVATFAFPAVRSAAQTVDVDIDLAGPWSYVVDPGDAARILVIAPYAGHTMAVFSGEDATQYESASHTPELGMHRLDFTPAPCGTHPSSSFSLYPVTVASADIDNAIGAKNNHYAISLPRPCSFESQIRSRMKASSNAVTPQTPEAAYSTWMVLHYKINGAPTANLVERPDTGTGGTSAVNFSSNTGSSLKRAISIVTYTDDSPDLQCDSHSSAAFDAAEDLWNLTRVNRLFPRVDASNIQQPTYNYRCSQTLAANDRKKSATAISSSESQRAKPKKPGQVHGLVPGRADCHAAQFNVNGAVS
jgi:hypothetical protein